MKKRISYNSSVYIKKIKALNNIIRLVLYMHSKRGYSTRDELSKFLKVTRNTIVCYLRRLKLEFNARIYLNKYKRKRGYFLEWDL